MKRYFSLLDPLRFVAAFWVMNYHYFLSGEPVPHLHWYRFGNLGVQIFFIISGFVIVQSLKGKTLKEFAWGRFIRLFPLFWFLCTITYILTVIFPDVRYTLHVSDYLKTMTMLGDIFNGIVGTTALIDPSYWTLTVEILFYAWIALFVHFFSYRHIRYFLIGWLGIAMIAFFLHVDENFYVKLLLVRHASYFIFGSALALLATDEAETKKERRFDWAILVASATYATYIHPRALPAHVIPHPSDLNIITMLHVLFFMGVPLCVYLSTFITESRVVRALSILGALTYPLYLLHQRIGNILIDLVTRADTVPWHIVVICFEVAMICAAYLVSVLDARFRKYLVGH